MAAVKAPAWGTCSASRQEAPVLETLPKLKLAPSMS